MERSARTLVVLSALLIVPLVAQNAFAGPIEQKFKITWSGAYGTGSALVDATVLSSGVFQVFSMTGTQNGLSISSLLNGNTFYGNTNKLYLPTGSVGPVDGGGLAFGVGSTDYTFYFNPPPSQGGTYVSGVEIWECTGPPMSGTNTGACHAYGQGSQLGAFSVTPAPEPSSIATLSSGLLGMAGLFLTVRRKRLV